MKNYIKNYPRPQFARNKWENLNGVFVHHFIGKGVDFFRNIIKILLGLFCIVC